MRGKVVVLDFWATWCHGCKTEIPWFIDFAHRYRRQGLQVIGVSMDGAVESLPVTVLLDARATSLTRTSA
jgi:thiol-disulfide isomerase/thioredoxin